MELQNNDEIIWPNELVCGFSFKSSIKNKATDDQLRKLGKGWAWAAGGKREHLRDCLTQKGWAVTPGQWRDGWKNSTTSLFYGACWMFLDFDGERKLVDVIADPFVQRTAAFIYTTASHGKKPGDRFRVVFELEMPIDHIGHSDSSCRDWFGINGFNRYLKALKHLVPGSDDAINAVSCLYGNSQSKVIDFPSENLLSLNELAETYEQIKPKQIIRNEAPADSFFEGTANDTLNNLYRWLKPVASDSYDKWIKVGAWIKSVVASDDITDDQGLAVFMDWSIVNYIGEKERRNDPKIISDVWDGLTGGRSADGEYVRANGLLKIRRLYHETVVSNLVAQEQEVVTNG